MRKEIRKRIEKNLMTEQDRSILEKRRLKNIANILEIRRGERKAKPYHIEVSRSKEEQFDLNVFALRGYPKASRRGGSK